MIKEICDVSRADTLHAYIINILKCFHLRFNLKVLTHVMMMCATDVQYDQAVILK